MADKRRLTTPSQASVPIAILPSDLRLLSADDRCPGHSVTRELSTSKEDATSHAMKELADDERDGLAELPVSDSNRASVWVEAKARPAGRPPRTDLDAGRVARRVGCIGGGYARGCGTS